MKRPLIADAGKGKLIGMVVLAAGFYILWDAYDGHGQNKPKILGPILPW